jgi:hypothetical protein
MSWVIENLNSPPCWIREPIAPTIGTGTLMGAASMESMLGITFQRGKAWKFASEEAAVREMLKIKLPRDWHVVKGID